MALSLNRPGELSDWISLSDATEWIARDILEEAEDPDAEEAGQWLAGVEVRVKTLTRKRYLELLAAGDRYAETEGPERVIAADVSDQEIMRAGLGAIRGLAGGDPPDITDDILEALAATKLHGLIAAIVLRFNSLRADERASLFT